MPQQSVATQDSTRESTAGSGLAETFSEKPHSHLLTGHSKALTTIIRAQEGRSQSRKHARSEVGTPTI